MNLVRRGFLASSIALTGLALAPLAASADELADITERSVLRIA
ncbi:MAG: hypothetical protein ACKVKF_10220 [Rhodobacterales bacterium]|nr:hypothetical protein [Puniceibacterium antarcticum]